MTARYSLPAAGFGPCLPKFSEPWGLPARVTENKRCPPTLHCLWGGKIGALGCGVRAAGVLIMALWGLESRASSVWLSSSL